ncbi:hypothetical protein, partial [Achromobacter xylosoxidans]|uniref:hypothetical protein n=3 Tax=Alcaligenes xylosoxydans xylosoxydans TaxID=85698 RepID=UPI001A93B901
MRIRPRKYGFRARKYFVWIRLARRKRTQFIPAFLQNKKLSLRYHPNRGNQYEWIPTALFLLEFWIPAA